MTLFILSYLGGMLTILSPCVLPVLPFVFARAGRPFATSTLPLLVGLALTFALLATLAAVGGGWIVRANEYGRIVAMGLLAVFGVMLLWPRLTEYVTQPLVAFGNRLSAASPHGVTRDSLLTSLLLGVAVGFLWAPCAGPILGLILTGAAIQGANVKTTLLLIAYATGAATSLAIVLLIGGRVLTAIRKHLGAGEWVRRGLGVAVLAAVAIVALGLDTGLLTRLSLTSTSRIEQSLVDKVMSSGMRRGGTMTGGTMTGGTMTGGSMRMAAAGQASPPTEGEFPPLSGAVAWLNSEPLTPAGLRGKVVLIDFWTYSCINCLRTLPYVRAWADKYRDHGLVVIGVHTPEFAFEKDIDNVRPAVRDLKIDYPVAVDNQYAIWSAFLNNYWPADYFIDEKGQIRGHAFGEGDYDTSERLIQSLLKGAGFTDVPAGLVNVHGTGVEAAADDQEVKTQETYVGYARAENFTAVADLVKDRPSAYVLPSAPRLNQWGLGGVWTVQEEKAVLEKAPGRIVFRFHARDLHLVLGPAKDGKAVRFRVLLDGKAPGENHGVDVDAQGAGTVDGQRLYQLIRQTGGIGDRTFTIEFEDAGVQAFSFTFG